MRTAKTLISLGGCPGWSESSLGAQVILLVCRAAAHFVVSFLLFFLAPEEGCDLWLWHFLEIFSLVSHQTARVCICTSTKKFKETAWKELSSRLSACVVVLYVVLIVCVPCPFYVWGRMWNSIVSVPDHCLFVNFSMQLRWILDEWIHNAITLNIGWMISQCNYAEYWMNDFTMQLRWILDEWFHNATTLNIGWMISQCNYAEYWMNDFTMQLR